MASWSLLALACLIVVLEYLAVPGKAAIAFEPVAKSELGDAVFLKNGVIHNLPAKYQPLRVRVQQLQLRRADLMLGDVPEVPRNPRQEVGLSFSLLLDLLGATDIKRQRELHVGCYCSAGVDDRNFRPSPVETLAPWRGPASREKGNSTQAHVGSPASPQGCRLEICSAGGIFSSESQVTRVFGASLHQIQLALEHPQLAGHHSNHETSYEGEPESEFRKSLCIDGKLACVFDKLSLALQVLIGMGIMLLACLLYYLSYGLFERGRIKLGGCVLLLGLCLWTGTGLTFTGWL